MRWDERFEALETGLALESAGEQLTDRDREIDELAVERAATVSWADRCRGREVTLRVAVLGPIRGELAMATADWLLVHQDASTDWVVAVGQVLAVTVAGGGPAAARREVERRTTWRQAWTELIRDRDSVMVMLVDGSTLRGVPSRAGSDYVEIADELVPYAAVVAVRCPR
ncbi:hypothetical protein FE697_015090 [Mumia zhuanghuii]|uniref:Uncharacterized protein n=2 Tax=Mumia TaxID=1546255 RepID=A0ABW1QQC3_9ACTN|nr:MULTISPECIES: hypothetical protein [Mumia]KAA1422465.1 hypothetical protein FE697_015090 [Mumia zhuanghuii]